MAKYRKRAIVEAVQWREGDPLLSGMELWTWREIGAVDVPCIIDCDDRRVVVQDGDWVIEDANGHHSACKPDIFEATYERVPMPVDEVSEEIIEIDEYGIARAVAKGTK